MGARSRSALVALVCCLATLGTAQGAGTCTAQGLLDFFSTNTQYWWIAAELADLYEFDAAVTVLLPLGNASYVDPRNYILQGVFPKVADLVAAMEVPTANNETDATASFSMMDGNVVVEVDGQEYLVAPIAFPLGDSVGYMIVPSTVENMPAPAPPVLGAPEPTGDDDTPGLQLGEVFGAAPGGGVCETPVDFANRLLSQNAPVGNWLQVVQALQLSDGDVWRLLYSPNGPAATVLIADNTAWNTIAGDLGTTFRQLVTTFDKERLRAIFRYNLLRPISPGNPFDGLIDFGSAPSICLNSFQGILVQANRDPARSQGFFMINPRADVGLNGRQAEFRRPAVQTCNSVSTVTNLVLQPGSGSPTGYLPGPCQLLRG